MVQILIDNFPMPPSANALYKNIGLNGRAKSEKYTNYEKLVKFWLLTNGRRIDEIRSEVKKMQPSGTVFYIERYLYFKKQSILTYQNVPKKNDSSNRIKALDDVIAKILGIDDCLFWDGSYFKRITERAIDTVSIKLTEIPLPIPKELDL